MAHRAQLDKPDKDGTPLREHLEVSAARGSPASIAALVPRECPEEVAYLVQWATHLCGRSGSGMNGFNPLSHVELRAWRTECGIPPLSPIEVDAITLLDAALRNPDAFAEYVWPTNEVG